MYLQIMGCAIDGIMEDRAVMICLCSYCITEVEPGITTTPYIVPQFLMLAIKCGVTGHKIIKKVGHHEQIIFRSQDV